MKLFTKYICLAGLAFLFLGSKVFAQQIAQEQLNIRQLDALHVSEARKIASAKNRNPLLSSPPRRQAPAPNILPSGKIGFSQSTSCNVSSGRNFIKKDSTNFYIGDVCRSADGKLLISGEYTFYDGTNFFEKGLLMKCDDFGNVLWAKTYDSLNHVVYSYFYYYRIIELQDGNIMMAGSTQNHQTENDDLVMTKTDPLGNIIWSKLYKSRIWTNGNGSMDYFYVQQMKEDPSNGDIYITGPHWDVGRNVTKFNASNGNIMWSNFYSPAYSFYFDRPFGIDILPGEIRSFGKFSDNTHTYISVYRLNKTTGDTIQTRCFKVTDTAGVYAELLTTDRLIRLNNGNYLLSGECYGFYPYTGLTNLYQASVVEIDANLNAASAYCFRNSIESNSYNTLTTLYPDGSGLFTMLHYISGYTADVYYVQFKEGVILKQRKLHYAGEGIPLETEANRMADGGDLIVRLMGDSATNSSKVDFYQLHISDTSSTCLGVNDYSTFVQPVLYGISNLIMAPVGQNDFLPEPNKTITLGTTPSIYQPGCAASSFCNALSLTASADTLCTAGPLLLTVHKNRECGGNVYFDYNISNVQSFIQLNDSTWSMSFNGSWQGYVHAGISGCISLLDSVPVVVIFAPGAINLGPDTTLCPGNTIVLNAHTGYITYHWNTGSTDSLITVNTPGTYYVDAIDACHQLYSDTIRVDPSAPIPFSIGSDRTKCNDDTLHLTATPGFLNYTWGPPYNISSLSGQQVTVQPMVDTLYYVKAEKTPGCFAYDSVHIHVNHSPAVNLGPDLGFCQGDSAILDAGPGFLQYAWNTGALTRQLTVFTTGSYSVKATTVQGCISFDTLLVTNVFPLPFIQLDKDTTLCLGASRTLSAGSGYSTYLWSTGAVTGTINVSATGRYWVTVTDANHCIGSDTTEIRQLLPRPDNFLPADTAICSYSDLSIKATKQYEQYVWSTGTAGPSLTISAAGLYWLMVTDKKGCIGKDSIIIHPKDCIKGFFIPTAFTPNHNGRNDEFKPLIFGVLKQYQFAIYNRLGQLVFSTSDIAKGWDGSVKGLDTDYNAFVWICTYQLAGEPAYTKKGSVILLR